MIKNILCIEIYCGFPVLDILSTLLSDKQCILLTDKQWKLNAAYRDIRLTLHRINQTL